jgi:hypothetical protein
VQRRNHRKRNDYVNRSTDWKDNREQWGSRGDFDWRKLVNDGRNAFRNWHQSPAKRNYYFDCRYIACLCNSQRKLR